jgi:Ca2+-binding RTX toxin-like protein
LNASSSDFTKALAGPRHHDDRLLGGNGADTLRGGFGDGRLFGGPGNDNLQPDDGLDILTFQANNGTDTIWGFDGGATLFAEDKIKLNGYGAFFGFDDLTFTETLVGDSIVDLGLQINGDGTILDRGEIVVKDTTGLTALDFVFQA